MAKNKKLIEIPCHRVVRSNGTVGEYALGSVKKAELLTDEGLTIINGKVQNLANVFHKFSA
jgi:methylated-DNA-[protein]-cysteine S-methyltransferase